MNVLLWVVQGLLALVFLMSGIMKVTQPKAQLETRMGWTKEASLPVIRTIGSLEVLGALGLILPALTGILPWLTPLAAVGLALVMVGASWTHIRSKEYSSVGMTAVLLVLALLAAVGRFWIMPL